MGFFKRIADAISTKIPDSKADARQLLDKGFDRTKRTSDFIGMIVRFAFVSYATQFFFSASWAPKAGPMAWLYGWAMGVSAMFSFGLMIFFAAQIFGIIYQYLLVDA